MSCESKGESAAGSDRVECTPAAGGDPRPALLTDDLCDVCSREPRAVIQFYRRGPLSVCGPCLADAEGRIAALIARDTAEPPAPAAPPLVEDGPDLIVVWASSSDEGESLELTGELGAKAIALVRQAKRGHLSPVAVMTSALDWCARLLTDLAEGSSG